MCVKGSSWPVSAECELNKVRMPSRETSFQWLIDERDRYACEYNVASNNWRSGGLLHIRGGQSTAAVRDGLVAREETETDG